MSIDLIFLFLAILALFAGYPVALTLGGTSILFALVCSTVGLFDLALFNALPLRIFGLMSNAVLVAIPLFVFMGLVLERSRIAADMLDAAALVFGRSGAGLTVSVTVVGMLLAASTGIVGASVVTLGLLAFPPLLRAGVPATTAGGTIAAAGTMGQIIPPSIVLIVLSDQVSNAWQKAQTEAGNFAPQTVSVADLFAAAIVPGLILFGLYIAWQLFSLRGHPIQTEESEAQRRINIVPALFPPLALILAVLGSIFGGFATPSEAASVGAVGALILAARRLTIRMLTDILRQSVLLIATIFLIIIGASIFALVFRGLGGDETVTRLLSDLPGGTYGALLVVMVASFLLGFVLEFLEITFIVVPLVAPVLLAMPMVNGDPMSPVWLAILIALNLQTSFLSPPFGLSLFYLRTVAPTQVTTKSLYLGIIPFVLLQLITLAVVIAFPALATFLPSWVFSG